ncbi:hypothetical protein PV08_11890 [Exophiala spinifera]|uniref:GST N-terminal domain-containing protein n=1 Tax=Exophiala spinifera TaxID=91928 RepID=A0A0D2ATD9_9EURO|nr:uncharacterized protein PV08_11890 [Exophiala spinifera]KIW09790.1 hypothetical protein PV08_11890 [Exophiala spinifera]
MSTDRAPKFTIYSSEASQWAMVPLLGIQEKGIQPHEYEHREIDLIGAGNFDAEYLKINHNGTLPALTTPSLDTPLEESADILEFLDRLEPSRGTSLAPKDAATKERAAELITLVHSMDLNSNLILLTARDTEELEKVKATFYDFITTRQRVLEENAARDPSHPFYGPKAADNNGVYKVYTTSSTSPEHHDFFKSTHEGYKAFANAFGQLESLLALPYAAGDHLTYADLNIIPWLSHVLCFAGAKDFNDFAALESLVRKTVPGFSVGPELRQWWKTIQERESFKKIYPVLH